MPPKARITKEMILDTAYKIAKEQGQEQINARSISKMLGCSTQPILYHFERMEDIKKEVYERADKKHTEYLFNIQEGIDPMTSIGINYIRFAKEEKFLFRMLFQSDKFSGQSIRELIDAPELIPALEMLKQEAGLTMEQARFVFKGLTMLIHGYASMLANNNMEYDENEIVPMLETAFMGFIGAIKMEEK